MEIKLYPHQQAFINKRKERAGLYFDVGTGKTYTALAWVKMWKPSHTYIICPLSVYKKWVDTVKGFFGWEIVDAQKRVTTFGKITIVTKEYWRDNIRIMGDSEAIIIDEAHYFSNNSKMTKNTLVWLRKYNPKYRLTLTATPYTSSCWNIYYALLLLGHDANFKVWRRTFQHPRQMGNKVIWQDNEDKESKQQLQRIINKIGFVLKKEDVYDVPDQNEHTIWHDLSGTAQQEIEMLEDETFMGFFINRQKIEQKDKVETLRKIVNKHQRVIIFTKYTESLMLYAEELGATKIINGATKDKETELEEVRTMDEYVIVVQSSISDGWELPDTDAIVFCGHSWGFKDLEQGKGRSIRINNPSETDIYHVLAKGGTDAAIWSSLKGKGDFSLKKLSTVQQKELGYRI